MPSLRGAALTWGRAELRRNWRREVLVGLLVAAVAGIVIATIAGARRTDTAVARFAAAGRFDAVVSAEPDVLAAATALPQVERHGLFTFVSLAVIGPPGHLPQDGPVATVSDPGPEEAFLEGVILVDGRIPNRDKPDEIAVDESAARHRNLRVGDEITLRPVSFEDGRPTGPESLQVTVVGVVRAVQDLDSDRVGVAQPTFSATDDLHLTPAFLAEYREVLEYYSSAVVYLKAGHDDLPAFSDGVRQLSGGEADVDTDPSDVTAPAKNARASARVQAVALLGVGAALGSAALLLLGQWLRRQTLLDEDRRRILRALGFTSRDLLTADFVRALGVGMVAAVGAGAIAVGLSPFFPMSTARRAEIDPGITVDWPIVCLGAATVLTAVVTLHLAAARSPARHQGVRPHAVDPYKGGGGYLRAGFLSRAGAPVAVTTGVRMAFEPGHGASAVPVRYGTGLAIVSVVALTAATVFAVSLDDFVGSPTSQGWNWDAAVTVDPSAGPPTSVLDEHPEIAEAALGTFGTFPAATANTTLAVLALEPLRGELLPSITAGRPPRGPDEVALGADTLAAFDLDLGETAVLIEGSPPFRVVGQAVLPAAFGYPNLSLGQGAVVTGAGLERIGGAAAAQEVIGELLVRIGAGGDTGHSVTRLTEELGGDATSPLLPPDVENLRLVRGLPFALAAALAAIGMLTIGHVLITTIRQRRRDIAILRALGFSGRQTGAAVVCQAATMVLIAFLVGLPVGLVVGRWAWTLTVEGIGGSARPVIPLWFLAWIPIGLVLAALVAAGPAWRAAHQRPVDALRAD